MSIRHLDRLFEPATVAVIGASIRPDRPGSVVLRNLLRAGFGGAIWPVNPKYREIEGLPAFRGVQELPAAPELAVVCTPPATLPGVIARLGERGTRAVVVVTGLGPPPPAAPGQTPPEPSLRDALVAAARRHRLRLLGPGSLGLLVPRIGLNASVAPVDVADGGVAFVAQSEALAAAVLDRARSHGVGFSRFLSLGDSADVDVADLLDYLGDDPETRAILLHVETVGNAREFLSAARAAARAKPVLVVKAGRGRPDAGAADEVFDAAIRRAGMLRVGGTDELFDALETLARARPPLGEGLAILANGSGPCVLAADALAAAVAADGAVAAAAAVDGAAAAAVAADGAAAAAAAVDGAVAAAVAADAAAARAGARLAVLEARTRAALEHALPGAGPRDNPVCLEADAPPACWADALRTLLEDRDCGAVLLIHAPGALVPGEAIARALAPIAVATSTPVLGCWFGGDTQSQARAVFAEAGIPGYETPEQGVRAFLQLRAWQHNQALLIRVPPRVVAPRLADTASAAVVVHAALAADRSTLTPPEASQVLGAYGITVAEAPADPAQEGTGEPALFAGMRIDPVFGPVLVLGEDGLADSADRAVGLPPLDAVLARDLLQSTRVGRRLAGHCDRAAAQAATEAVVATLLALSQLVVDLPEIAGIELHPLRVDGCGAVAAAARVAIAPAAGRGEDRLAIRPYPQELEERLDWQGQALWLRPIRPQDAPQHLAFFRSLEPEDVRSRAFAALRKLLPSQLARLTQIDYDREMAFVATRDDAAGSPETLGVARASTDPDNECAEFAIVVRSDLKGRGLGRLLLERLVAYCRARGTRRIVGTTFASNAAMLALARRAGFSTELAAGTGLVELSLDLGG